MLMHEKKRKQSLMKGSKRQERFREKQRNNQLFPLQVRITRYSHRMAKKLKEKQGGKISDIYEAAILDASTTTPPVMHEPSFEEDDLGVRSICPWVQETTVTHFDKVATHYRSTVTAMSAILYQYCKKKLNE